MKAALYTRVSSEDQVEGFSLAAQIKALREYCLKNGIEIYNEYVDEGVSGQKEDRPQFQKMISESKEYDIILVHKFDRFARKIELSHRIKAQLKKNNVNVISITEPVEDSPIGFFQEGLLELLAEYYVRNLSKEVKKGHVERASQGLYNGGPAPYGYYAENGKLFINEDEAKIVRLIYDKFISGVSTTKISDYLVSNRLTTKDGCKFGYWQVSRILKNPKYTGNIYYAGQLYPGQHEAIVSQSDFDIVQSELNRKINDSNFFKNTYRGKNFDYFFLIGILFCANCKARFAAINSPSKTISFKFVYTCARAKRYDGKCNHHKLYNKHLLEDEIMEYLNDIRHGKISVHLNQNKPDLSDIFIKRQKDIAKELDRAKQAYLSEVFSIDEYKEIKNKLEEELKNIRSEVPGPKKSDTKKAKDLINGIWKELVNEQDINKKRNILKTVIDKILIYKDGEIEFYLKY